MAQQHLTILLLVLICSLPSRFLRDKKIHAKPATLFIFSDYQSPSCRAASTWLERLRRQHSGQLRLVIKHYPLPGHPQSFLAARAAYCAAGHKRFWEYHKRLLMVSDLSEPMLIKYAVELSIDEFEFEQCLESDASRMAIDEDREEALRLKLTSLPAFILDGRLLIGVRSLADLLKELRAAQDGVS